MKQYDYIIVGAGFYGAICAYELTKKGYKCLIVEKRNHIGGNCYTWRTDSGIDVHEYGPHIFHTSDKEIWDYINQFTPFNNFIFSPVAQNRKEIYSLPFNMWTFAKIYGKNHPEDIQAYLKRKPYADPKNLEEMAINLVGRKAYNILIKHYTQKQWGTEPKNLPKEIIQRLPVRFTYDGNYFNDTYQGIPSGGYTKIFERLLENVEVRLNVDYLQDKDVYNDMAYKIIFTGPIDAYFNYRLGYLDYKSTNFYHNTIPSPNIQGTAVKYWTGSDTRITRSIEHKHFTSIKTDDTVLTIEIPTKYKPNETTPLYPINNEINNELYMQYKDLANQEAPNIHFGGRLAEYRYYDMHQVIKSALDYIKNETLNK